MPPFHHIFSGPPGKAPELVARDVETPQGVKDVIRAQLNGGPSAIRVVTSAVKFEQEWKKFCAEDLLEAEVDSDGSTSSEKPTYSDVLGTWAEVTDEFIKD